MRDLAAQVTSSLLRFPEVTVDALGEDEVTLDSVLHGKFTVGRSGLAWLACGPQLEVVHAVTAERFSAYCFSGVTEHPPSVLAVRDFCWLKRTGLLVGLEEAEGSMLCLYDLGISRVVKAVVIPGRITAIEPLVSYGGASASTQHLHQSLRWFFGVAAVVTHTGHVLLVDLCLDDLSCSQSELEASDLEVVNKSPSEIPRLREGVTRQGRHLGLQLSGPAGTGATALQYVPRTNQLAVGFSDGYLQLWNMKTLKKEYHSQLEGGRVPVYAFTFQEPENDPRNCCYLWAVQSAQDHEGDVVSLHLLQLAFGERQCLASGKILYEGLEYCEERYSQDLSGTTFPLRAQATNTRLLSCQTIEKFRHHPDRDESTNEGASPDTSVSIFSWQVKSYGQGQPSTYIGVFDINRWYHAQMPDSLRAGESLRSCPYLAVWSLDSVVEMTSPCPLLDVLVHERSLSRGLPFTCPPPEQFFNPTTYNFDASCLLNSGIVHLTCSGYQKETLSYLKKAAPYLSDRISDSYSRCLMSGLLSSRLADVQPSALSQEEQLDAILSTAVETSSLGLITGCIKQWTTEEQPGSAVNLRYILEWAWDKVVHTKEELDGICAPLFDSSSNFTDPQTLQLLQHSQRLLGNLSTIFHCLLNEAQELTQKGLVGLINKNMVSSLISQYAQVVLWFCRTGLLPEGSDDDLLQISRPFYSYSVIKNYYTGQREELQRLAKGKWCADCLMIDGLVAQCGEHLADLWKRDEGGTGQYPPPTLHALLDIYLLENMEESAKHAIVIYLLLDVMYSFPNKSSTAVESFPTAFAIPVGLVKLVQGLWLLDHHDHESSLELLLHPATSHPLWAWQHSRVLQALMCQRQHAIALRYLHVMKPPMSSTGQAKLCLSVLLHNRCLVEAWALLRQHSDKLNLEELLRFLYETCQELGLMKELLKLPLGLAEQECLERFLQDTGGFQNRELLMVHYLQQANYVPALQLNQALKMNQVIDRDPKMKERSNTRNSILNQYGKVLPRAQRKLAIERAKPYHHPSTVLREVTRPQPLSTVAKRSATESVLTRAAFINNVLSKIEEVWVGKGNAPESSPLKSVPEALVPIPSRPSLNLPEAFVGTPITMATKRMSRILDLVVQPSSQASPNASHLLRTPPRPLSSWSAPRSITKAPELSLLQTPQVVKRARALAASGPVFSAFTPQSILRSSLRPTPVATPAASPRRSVTPPPCPKESRITFIEEADSPDPPKGPIHWSNGIAADSEISLLRRSSPLPKSGMEAWSAHSNEEEEEEEEELEEEVRVTCMPPDQKPPSEEKDVAESGSSVSEVPPEEPALVMPALMRRPSLGQETSEASVHSVDTTLEFHDAPSPEDLMDEEPEQQRVEMEEDDEVVVVSLANTAAEVVPTPESSVKVESSKVSQSEEEVELPVVSQSADEEELPAESVEEEELPAEMVEEEELPAVSQSAEEEELPAVSQSAEAKPSVDQEMKSEEDLGQEVAEEQIPEPEKVKIEEVPAEEEREARVEASLQKEVPEEQITVHEAAEESEPAPEVAEEPNGEPVAAEVPNHEPEVAEELTHEHLAAEESKPESEVTEGPDDAAVETTNHGPEVIEESNHVPEVVEEPTTETEVAVEPNLKGEKEEPMDHTDADLDYFVERHLFGNDLSLTRSGIREADETWTSFNSECVCDTNEEQPVPVDAPVPTTQKSVSSASSGLATCDSHSVVSLNSEELSSVASEEESDAAGEEEEEEDSGSEVEIIEEVKGNGQQHHQSSPALYLEVLPPHTQYLQEQASAVLALVTPEAQVVEGLIEEEEEGEVVMVGLDHGDLVVDGNEAVCYTELKPSTTLLVPLELADDLSQPIVVGGALGALGSEPEVPPSGASDGFSLMLEAEDVDEAPVESELDPNNHLLIMKLPQDIEQPEEVETDADIIYLDPTTNQDPEDEIPPPPEVLFLTENLTEMEANEAFEEGEDLDCKEVFTEETDQRNHLDAKEALTDELEAREDLAQEDVPVDMEMPAEADAAHTEEEMPAESSAAHTEDQVDSEPAKPADGVEVEQIEVEPVKLPESELGEMEGTVLDLNEGQSNGMMTPSKLVEVEEDVPAPEVEEEPNEMSGGSESPLLEEAVLHEAENEQSNKDGVLEIAAMETEETAPDTEDAQVPENNVTQVDEEPTAIPEKEPAGVEDGSKTIKEAEPTCRSVTETSRSKTNQAETTVEDAEIMNEAPPTSTQKTNSRRKVVTFPSPLIEAEKDLSDEERPSELMDSEVPSTPRRVTRSGKHSQDSKVPVTPRRRAKKADPELQKNEVEDATSNDIISKPETPMRKTPLKSTPRKGTRRTRNTAGSDEDAPTVESPLHNEDSALPGRLSARKSRVVINEVPEIHLVVPEEKPVDQPAKAPNSPGRVTRKSSRGFSLALESFQQNAPEEALLLSLPAATPPRSRRKTRASTVEKTKDAPSVTDDTPLQSASCRLTRSRLWNHSEDSEKEREDRPLLETPLEVGPGTPLADALMERLKDEEAREENAGPVVTEIVRATRRGTKSASQRVPSPPPSVAENPTISKEVPSVVEPRDAQPTMTRRTPTTGRRTRASKAPEPDTSPVRDSFLFSSALKRTRGKTPVPNDISVPDMVASPPVTRTRRSADIAVSHTIAENAKGDDVAIEAEAAKPRRKRTTKTKAAPEPPPQVQIDLMSPLASPAEPTPRAQRRVEEREKEETEPASLRMNLRRKRMMDAIFPKPVTRRKKL